MMAMPFNSEVDVVIIGAGGAGLEAAIEAALSGAVDVLWLVDKKGRTVGVPAAKIAYVEIGSVEGDRRIGFGG